QRSCHSTARADCGAIGTVCRGRDRPVVVQQGYHATFWIQEVLRVRREVDGIVTDRINTLAEGGDCLVGTLPRSRLRRERQECIRFLVPAHERAAKNGGSDRQLVEFTANFPTNLVEAPRLKDEGDAATACRDGTGLEQRSCVGERAVRRAEPFPWMKDADPRRREALLAARHNTNVRVLDLEEVFGRDRQL